MPDCAINRYSPLALRFIDPHALFYFFIPPTIEYLEDQTVCREVGNDPTRDHGAA
jgi:hypothetical protein